MSEFAKTASLVFDGFRRGLGSIAGSRASDWVALERHPYPEGWWATEILIRFAQSFGGLRCIGIEVPAVTDSPIGEHKGWLPDFLFEIDGARSRNSDLKPLLWTELKVANLSRFHLAPGSVRQQECSSTLNRYVNDYAAVWEALSTLRLEETQQAWEIKEGPARKPEQLMNIGENDRAQLGMLTVRRDDFLRRDHWIAACLVVHGVQVSGGELHVWKGGKLTPFSTRMNEISWVEPHRSWELVEHNPTPDEVILSPKGRNPATCLWMRLARIDASTLRADPRGDTTVAR
jgi:hypothetical protein